MAHYGAVWAVPVFFMITGYLILDPEREITTKKLKMNCVRVLLAIIIFSGGYGFLKQLGNLSKGPIFILGEILKAIIECSGSGHLWYLYVLLGIYLVLPLFRLLVQKTDVLEIDKLLMVLLVFDFVLPWICSMVKIRDYFSVPFTYPIFYILLGYRLKNKSYRKNIAHLIGLICVGGILAFAYVGVTDDKFIGYMSPLTAGLAGSIFWMIINTKVNYSDGLWNLDRLCFAVYLIHPVFIHFLYEMLKISPINFKLYFLAAIGMWILFSICSFIGAVVMRKIPLLKKYIL